MSAPTWAQLFHIWWLLMAASVGWDMGGAVSRSLRARFRRWRRRKHGPDTRAALRAVIGMVDQMDAPASRGGGVLPVDKARIMHEARKAAGS